MFVYLATLILITIFYFLIRPSQGKINKIIFSILSFLILLAVSSLRKTTVGIDLNIYYAHYYPRFENVSWDNVQNVTISGHWELGFCILCKCLCLINPNPQFFIFVSSLLTLLPISVLIHKKSNNLFLSYFIFITFNTYMMFFNVVREGIAVGMCVSAYLLFNRNKILSALFFAFAVSIHTTAIVFLLIIPFIFMKLTKARIITIIIFSLVTALILESLFERIISLPVFNGRYDFYLYDSYESVVSGYITVNSIGQFLIPAFILFIESFVIFTRKLTLKPSDKIYYASSIIVTALRFSTFTCNLFSRVYLYFVPLMICGLPTFLSKLGKGDRETLIILLCFVSLIYFILIGYFRAGDIWGTVPYEFFMY